MPHPTESAYAERDWASLARDYAAKALTVEQIAALYAVSRTALYDRARLEGWRKRMDRPARPKPRKVRRTGFHRRLLTALDRKIADFEARRDDAPSAADAERDARTLNTLVRLYDKLQGMADKSAAATATAAARPADAIDATAAKDAHDPDGLRRELARRLETLRLSLGD